MRTRRNKGSRIRGDSEHPHVDLQDYLCANFTTVGRIDQYITEVQVQQRECDESSRDPWRMNCGLEQYKTLEWHKVNARRLGDAMGAKTGRCDATISIVEGPIVHFQS